MPRNASLNASGFRFYEWVEDGLDPVRVLSVTSIRRLTGINWVLSEWMVGNVVRLACGIRKVTVIGPKGGVKEKYVNDGDFPGEFVRRMAGTHGHDDKIDAVRKWLRETADEPRDVAAVRGSVVHKLIELGMTNDRLEVEIIDQYLTDEWRDDKRVANPLITDDDRNFVRNGVRQYWNMRAEVPFVILAQEPQVWNLTAGYAGSADVLLWFLGEFEEDGTFIPLELPDGQDLKYWQREASRGKVTVETVAAVGGTVALGDWKTSKGVYTDHVIQMHAYLAGEFIGSDGKRDQRLTDLLSSMMTAVLFHIRPDGWAVDFVDFSQRILYGFLGSVAFARLIAEYPKPEPLFTHSIRGSAPETEESENLDDDAA